MSYSYHLYTVDKDKLNAVKGMNQNELNILTEPIEVNTNCKYPYIGHVCKCMNAKEILEFSQDSELFKEIYPLSEYVFKDNKINEYYNKEDDFVVFGQPLLLLDAIHSWYASKIRNYYNGLLSDEGLSQEDHYKLLLRHIRRQLSETRYLSWMPDRDYDDALTASDLYEYEIFNLLHTKKIFNIETQDIILRGF